MAKKVLLLANLGSPNSTATKDVKSYLAEFLMDERVIDIPYFARLLLVRGIIVPFRAPKSAEKYKTIWSENGSPLIHITNQLATKVQQHTGMPTYVCMRYANPTPKYALDLIKQQNPDVEEVVMLPLYPHYAMSSYETAVVHVQNTHQTGNYGFALKVVKPFYNHPKYIAALANSIKPYLTKPYDHVLFSYHGIPQRHVTKIDPTGNHCFKCENCCAVPSPAHDVCYRHQISKTTELVAKELNLPQDKFSFSFQSRLGQEKWLQPYTTVQLKSFPKKNIKNLVVLSPAFVSDCLETLEEIHVEGMEDFMHAGGQSFTTVPCLNTNQEWIETIQQLVNEA